MFPHISYRSSWEKLIKYQYTWTWVIMFSILMTSLTDKPLILHWEVWLASLLDLKGLSAPEDSFKSNRAACHAESFTGKPNSVNEKVENLLLTRSYWLVTCLAHMFQFSVEFCAHEPPTMQVLKHFTPPPVTPTQCSCSPSVSILLGGTSRNCRQKILHVLTPYQKAENERQNKGIARLMLW